MIISLFVRFVYYDNAYLFFCLLVIFSCWCPRASSVFNLLLSARITASFISTISDCDETFNYWEPVWFFVFYLLNNFTGFIKQLNRYLNNLTGILLNNLTGLTSFIIVCKTIFTICKSPSALVLLNIYNKRML